MSKRVELDYDKIYTNKKGEQYKIIKYVDGRDKNGSYLVLVEFLKTGYQRVANLSLAKQGRIADRLFDPKIIYTNSKGQRYHIIAYDGNQKGNTRCIVEFLDTGFRKSAPMDTARKGCVRDNSVGLFDPNKVLMSTKDGPFHIIDVNYDAAVDRYKAKIRFENTGYEKIVGLQEARIGEVKDDTLRAIDPNMVYYNNAGQPFRILEQLNYRNVRVHFDNTGYEKVVSKYAALQGAIADNSIPEFDPDEIHMSYSYGPFKIIEKSDQKDKDGKSFFLIEFCLTGYQKLVSMGNILKGNIKDEWQTMKIQNVKALSKDEYDRYILGRLRQVWGNMISRCTNPLDAHYPAYGGLGVRVCNEWLNFDGFMQDLPFILQYDKFMADFYNYQLDKDYLQFNIPPSQRIYSRSTCAFLLSWDNFNLRILEMRKQNTNPASPYIGVFNSYGKFDMQISINDLYIHHKFTNAIAAANAFNYYFEYYHRYELVPLHNDVPYMPVQEWITYIAQERQPLYKIVKP